jgi:hypothetical protein
MALRGNQIRKQDQGRIDSRCERRNEADYKRQKRLPTKDDSGQTVSPGGAQTRARSIKAEKGFGIAKEKEQRFAKGNS